MDISVVIISYLLSPERGISRKRTVLVLVGSGFEQPPTWTYMEPNENISVVPLLQSSQEFKAVQDDFLQNTEASFKVVKVIQN